jgi:hypothetical protein
MDAGKMGVLLTGTPGNTYEFEVVLFYEAISGSLASGLSVTVDNVSRSHSDTGGLSIIRDFLGGVYESEVGQAVLQRGVEFVKGHFMATGVPLLQYL